MGNDLKHLKRDLDLGMSWPTFSPRQLPQSRPLRRRGRWPYVAVSGVAISALAWWLIRPLPPPRVVGTTQITNDGRAKWMPLVAGDSRVFYSAGLDNEVDQVSAKGGETSAIPLPAGETKLIDLSPDASELLVGRRIRTDTHNSADELWVVPLPAGAPRRLGDLLAENNAAAWSRDGKRLIYAIHNELHLARRDGTEIQKLATTLGAPLFLRLSPDGSKARFSTAETKFSKMRLWEASVESGDVRPLLPEWQPTFSLFCGNWSPDGRRTFRRGSTLCRSKVVRSGR